MMKRDRGPKPKKMDITIIKNTVVGGVPVFVGDHLTVKYEDWILLKGIGRAVEGHVDVKPKKPIATVEEVWAALDGLDPKDKESKGKDGKPSIAKLEDMLGKVVTEEVRDEALEFTE